MAGQNNAMEVRFRANMRDLERELQRLNRINSRAAQQMADAHRKAAKAAESAWNNNTILSGLQRQIGAMGPQLRALSATIAGLFAGHEALKAAETWTRFTNSLKVAGVEGNNLKVVQDQLYKSAIANGVAIEPLGTLYSRLSQSAGELGASQSQLLKFANGVTAALRVQGGDAASASGALLQMSQALAGGTVRAEEFNSINEGARPILEAVARGSDKYGGSVAKLRAAMIDGNLSSKEFFDNFLKGSASLEAQAAKAPLTVTQAMTNLHTAFTKFVGETDATYGVTERIGQAIGTLSKNLDVLGQSIMIVGGIYAATFLPALGRAGTLLAVGTAATIRSTVASVADTVALVTRTAAIHNVSRATVAATLASRGLQAALAFMGGPIGIAILAIGAAIAYLGTSSVNAALETEALSRSIDGLTKKREEAEAAQAKAKVATDNMSSAQRSQLEHTARLTNQVALLSSEYGRLAVEAKRAAVEMSAQQWVKANDDFLKAKGAAEAARPRRARGGNAATAARQDAEWQQSEEYQTAQTAWKNRNWALGEYGKVRGQNALEFAPKPLSVAPEKPKKGGAKATAKDRGDDAVAAAEREYRDALAASAVTAEERHKYALEALSNDRDEKLRQLAKKVAEKTVTDADAAKVKETIAATYTQRVANLEAARKLEVDEQAREQVQAGIDLANEAARIEADNLTDAARYERDTRKRHAMERSALSKKQAAEDAAFKLQQDQLALDRQKAGWTKEVIDRLRQQAESNREAQKTGERADMDRDQSRDRPTTVMGQIIGYAESFGTLNEQLGSIANGAIDDISRGFADAVLGAGSFKEAMTDMAKSVIAQLIEMAAKFAIFEAIGMAFGVKGLGKASLGITGKSPTVAKNAKGTDRFAGGLSMVGENGPELAYMPAGTQIAPNNLLRNALKNGAGRSAPTNNNYFSTTVNANDAVLAETVKGWISQSQVESVAASQKLIGRQTTDSQRNRLVRK
jgi:tape measure domain-containing protein